MRQDIYIIGAGGLARETFCLLCDLQQFNVLAYVDQNESTLTKLAAKGVELPVITEVAFEAICEKSSKKPYAVIAVGHPKVRKFIAQKFISLCEFPNVIHPSNIITGIPEFGIGNLVQMNGTFTDNVKIGNFNLLNGYLTCGHDVTVGDYNVVLPMTNLSGYATIGDENLIGAQTFIMENKRIGNRNTIGVGSMVLRNVGDDCVMFGVPATKMKF